MRVERPIVQFPKIRLTVTGAIADQLADESIVFSMRS